MAIDYGGYNLSLASEGEELIDFSYVNINSITLTERVHEVPSFTINYSPQAKFNAEKYRTAELSLESTIVGTQNWPLTILRFSPSTISGLLIKSDLIFDRYSQNLSPTLTDSIRTLGVRDSVSGCESVSESEDTFYQYNETALECTQRLLNMAGQDTFWTISWDQIKVFSYTPTNTTVINIGNEGSLNCDRSKTSETNFTEVLGSTDRYNINFGRYSVCVPRLSEFPLDCVASTVHRRLFRGNLFNTLVTKTYPNEPELSVGDYVTFENWQDYTNNSNYVVVGRTVQLTKNNSNYMIEFANMDGWL